MLLVQELGKWKKYVIEKNHVMQTHLIKDKTRLLCQLAHINHMSQVCSADVFSKEGLICFCKFVDMFTHFTMVEEQCT